MFEKQIKYYLLIKREISRLTDDTALMPYSDIKGIVYFDSLKKAKVFIKILLSIEVYPPYKLENIKLRKITEEEVEIKI